MKVLAPDPDCACAGGDLPGVIDFVLSTPRPPGYGADYVYTPCDTVAIRSVCACVRAVDIEARSEKLAGDGAYKIEHIPIVRAVKT